MALKPSERNWIQTYKMDERENCLESKYICRDPRRKQGWIYGVAGRGTMWNNGTLLGVDEQNVPTLSIFLHIINTSI